MGRQIDKPDYLFKEGSEERKEPQGKFVGREELTIVVQNIATDIFGLVSKMNDMDITLLLVMNELRVRDVDVVKLLKDKDILLEIIDRMRKEDNLSPDVFDELQKEAVALGVSPEVASSVMLKEFNSLTFIEVKDS